MKTTNILAMCACLAASIGYSQNSKPEPKALLPTTVNEISVNQSNSNPVINSDPASNPTNSSHAIHSKILSLESKINQVESDSVIFVKTKAIEWIDQAKLMLDSLKSLNANE
jgi:hypothetical protein